LLVFFRLLLFRSTSCVSQSILTEESKSAYNILIEKPVADNHVISQHLPAAPTPPSEPEDSNPLRMLRSGGLTVVRPKIRGNKHHSQSSRDSRELKVKVMAGFFITIEISIS
jgi:hypothetical protein